MKPSRVGMLGKEKPAMIDADGIIRDLSAHIKDVDSEALDPARLRALASIDPAALPAIAPGTRYGPPVAGTRKFIAIGLNYVDDAAEPNMPIFPEPVIFTKAVSCIQGPDDPVVIPRGSEKTDWEVELGIVIGSRTSYVAAENALNRVAGYLVVNDVSERAYQFERGGTWDKGKGCDTFGPIGPWLVTVDDITEPQNLGMWLDLNGAPMQRGNTRTMIFPVADIVAYVSQFMTLEAGDIITTGTPPGVGMGKSPPLYLKPGDTVALGIEGLGTQQQSVKA